MRENIWILALMVGIVSVFGAVTAYEYQVVSGNTQYTLLIAPQDGSNGDQQLQVTIDGSDGSVSTPAYAGSPTCDSSDEATCRKACINEGPIYAGGNWFLHTKCTRVNHPLYPNSPTIYALRCECNWWDAGWGDATVA